jgi:hypothetical protein
VFKTTLSFPSDPAGGDARAFSSNTPPGTTTVVARDAEDFLDPGSMSDAKAPWAVA